MKSSKEYIDTTGWKEFVVGKLFDIHPTKAYKVKQSELFAGENKTTPVISNTSQNNGVIGYTNFAPTEDGNILTFSDTVDANTIFYQPVPFIGYAHVQGMYPYDKEHWNEKTLLFFRSCFSNVVDAYGFDYNKKFNRDIAAKIKVLLPVDENGELDWAYMENFMSDVMEHERSRIAQLKDIHNQPEYVDVHEWEEFSLPSIFGEVKRGQRLKVADRVDGDICLLTAGKEHQGYAQSIGNVNMPIFHDALTIDMFGNCFWHDGSFTGDDNILVLTHERLNKRTGLFIASVINAKHKQDKYDYGKQYRQKTYANDKIFLPVDANGNPDWDYMNGFMSEIIERERERDSAEVDNLVRWKSFHIDQVFSFSNPKKKFNANKVIIKDEQEDGTHPYVVRSGNHNGIRGYINEDEQYLNDGGTLSFGQDTATVFYQQEPYFTGDKIKIMTPIGFSLTPNIAQFILTCLRKSFATYFWGAISFKQSQLEQEKVLLPVDCNGVLDLSYMEHFMDNIIKQERERLNKME